MGRIPGAEVERLKKEVSLQGLVEAAGVTLRRHGADLIGLCPFHEDREPSLVITPSKNLWHCLGACREGGTVIDWVMRVEGVSFRHAVEMLRGPASGNGDSPTDRQAPAPDRISAAAGDDVLLRSVVGYYHETLKQSPEALRYLEGRGLGSPEMIERFQMGFVNRTLSYRLPERGSKEGRETRERLERLGILRASGHEHLLGCVTAPIFDGAGRVAEMYGRRIIGNLPASTPAHLYLPGAHRGVWNLEALAASREIILCEALFDALTFWCAGHRNVTCSYGVSGFTADHLEAFKRHKTERVLIAYDRDDAGDKAAAALAEKLAGEGIESLRILFPHGMDANLYACKVTPAAKSLEVLIRGAVWLAGGSGGSSGQWLVAGGRQADDLECEMRDEATMPEPALSPAAPELVSSLAASLPDLVPPPTTDPGPPTTTTLPPAPPAPKSDVPAEIRENEVVIALGDRRWRIRGLAKNMSYEQLKVNVLVSRGEAFHVDNVDLYSARQRGSFTTQAASEINIEADALRKDLGRVLLKLEELQDEQIRKTLEPKVQVVEMTEEERAEAMAFLKDPKLIERIGADFEACGLVGEEIGRIVCYLLLISRFLEKPFAIMIQSSSAAGKSAMMTVTLLFVPDEHRVQYAAVTGQSLFYMEGGSLRHKVLAIAEEEGAMRASYALKLLQSEGKLSIASTGKDPATGRHVTHEYHTEGPTAILLTTTAIDLDEELLNRCVVVTVNEGREQTRAIHRMQRERYTLEGLMAQSDREAIRRRHQNAQRLLRPLGVFNPYVRRLTFLDDKTRTRRDHEKYLTLIAAIALLHQYQRLVRTREQNGKAVEYVEASLDDIALANRLAAEVLGRALDELPPQTRRLLMLIEKMVEEACARLKIERSEYRFSRRDVREYTGWGNTQLKIHLARLMDMEYLILHRGPRGSFVYELLYDGSGKDGESFLLGLIDVEKLRKREYDEKRSGFEAHRSGLEAERSAPGRPPVGGWSGGGRDEQTPIISLPNPDYRHFASKNAYLEPEEKIVVVDVVVPVPAGDAAQIPGNGTGDGAA